MVALVRLHKNIHSNITDHYSTILSLGNILDNRNNKPNPLKILKTDHQKLSNSIENHNWSEVHDFTDVNKATRYFTSTVNNLKNQASAEISIPSKINKLKPWATTAIVNSIRQRDRLHLQVKKHPHNLKLKNYYAKFRNKVTNIIKNAKIFYYKTELPKSGSNPKLNWQVINNIIARNKKSNSLKKLLNNSKNKNEFINENPEYALAEKFNNYFTNAIDLITLLKHYKNSNNYTTKFNNNSQSRVSFNKFDPITHNEILEAISNLKNGSSPGLDKISSDLLKKHSLTFCKPLSYIFNSCLSQNKLAITTLKHKKRSHLSSRKLSSDISYLEIS